METFDQGSQFVLTRRELFNVIKGDGVLGTQDKDHLLIDYLKTKFKFSSCSESMDKEIRRHIRSFIISLKQRWNKCSRYKKMFLNKNCTWLDTNITIINADLPSTSTATVYENVTSQRLRGRPLKNFTECGPKAKRRKIDPIVSKASLDELTFATQIKFKNIGKRDAANILGSLTRSPKRATKIKKTFRKSTEVNCAYSADEALALITSAKLSKGKYNIIRMAAKTKGIKIYPSNHAILMSKKKCYPPESKLIISDTGAEINIQALVDLTIRRSFTVVEDVLFKFCKDGQITLYGITSSFKWGCDGSGGQSRYKQKFQLPTSDDSNVLVSSIVPIQIYGYDENEVKRIVWQNPKTSSTSYCRPIRFRFVKESEEEILNEFEHIRNQLKVIKKTKILLKDTEIEISSIFEETMVDGKVCNALAGNKSTQRCYICHATPKDMNKLENIKRRISDPNTFAWGLSTLHANIRFMECLLHIAYRLHVKKWQVRSSDEKASVAERKKNLIKNFREETGLLLDTPKQGGGNTNDGNSARRFFKHSEITSQLTGINEGLIKRFRVILKTISCDYEVNVNAFEKYCNETAQLYVQHYNWYPMPVTVHKILIHGPEVIKHFLLPIGQLSEDVQESRHKEFRKFRLDYSRKHSRISSNTDILHNLLISSDPVIVALRPEKMQKLKSIDQEVLKLLKSPDVGSSTNVAIESVSESEEDNSDEHESESE